MNMAITMVLVLLLKEPQSCLIFQIPLVHLHCSCDLYSQILTTFVIVPEVLGADREGTGARKKMLPVEEYYGYNLKVMWDFEGILRYSPIFYGYYSSKESTKAGYQTPLAYFCAGMAVYIFRYTGREQEKTKGKDLTNFVTYLCN